MFITEKGSTYFPEVRVKYDGSRHKRGVLTIFVTERQMMKIEDLLSMPGVDTGIWRVGSCLAVVVSKDGILLHEYCKYIRGETEPRIGLYPVEAWEEGKDGFFHLGHRIIQVE